MRFQIVTLVMCVSICSTNAQSISLDTAFRSILPDKCVDVQPRNVSAIVHLGGGQTIALGTFTDLEADTVMRIVRLDAAGRFVPLYQRDPRFGKNIEEALFPRSNGDISILTSRNSTWSNTIGHFVVGADGTLRSATSNDSIVNGYIWDQVIGVDDAIFLGGRFIMQESNMSYGCVKIRADGTLDPQYSRLRINKSGARAIAVSDDGNVYLGGNFDTVGTYKRIGIVRLLPNGEVDTSFDVGLADGQTVIDVLVQPNKGIIVIGRGPGYADASPFIRRYHFDGTPDATFVDYDTASYTPTEVRHDESGGLLIIGGYFNGTIQRADADGRIDTSFQPPPTSGMITCAVSADDRILVGGEFYVAGERYHPGLINLNGHGAIDHAYNLPCNPDRIIASIFPCSDGTLVLGSRLVSIDTTVLGPTVAIGHSGVLRPEFRQRGLHPSVFGSVYARKMFQSPDGTLLVFESGYTTGSLYRLHKDGSRDTTYGLPADMNGSITRVDFLPDGRCHVVWTTRANGAPARFHLARLHTNGAIDQTFSTGTGLEGTVTAQLVQSDGRVLIAGALVSYNGTNVQTLIRLQPDGQLDDPFSADITLGYVVGTTVAIDHLAQDSQGGIIIAGRFDNVNDRIYTNVARLRPNGMLDLTFAPDMGRFSSINDIAVDGEDGVIIAGSFTMGETSGLARCGPDGALDPSFTVDLNGSVLDIHFVAPDTLYAVGSFETIGEFTQPSMARFVIGIPSNVGESATPKRGVSVVPNPASEHVNLHFTNIEGFVTVHITDVRGVRVHTLQSDTANVVVDVHNLSAGVYHVLCQSATSTGSTTMIITHK